MTAPEFSRPVDLARLGGGAMRFDIAADANERADLARRFGLVSLDRLEARVELSREAGATIRFRATLSADLVQSCVVTLDPVANRVDDEFSLLLGDPDDPAALDPDAELIEPLEDGRVDLGEVVAQQLSLAMDPYPRAPGVAPADGEGRPSPFAALAKLREIK